MPNPVVYFEVIGKDHDALCSFFGELFGWEIQRAGGGDYSFANPGEGITGGIGASPDEKDSRQTFFVEVEDLRATLDKANSLGAKTIMEPTQVSETADAAVFEDPEGHTIGIVSPRPRS
jgi:predicted enzyme related to lactoylglutathione lyase